MIRLQRHYDASASDAYGDTLPNDTQKLVEELWAKRQDIPAMLLITQLLQRVPHSHQLTTTVTFCAALLDLFQGRDELNR